MTDLPKPLLDATSAITADALDSCGLRDRVLDARLKPVFPHARFVGRAYPVSVVDDPGVPDKPYDGEMDALSAMSPGDVGVYAVAGSNRAAAWGELFSCGAIGRGAVGVIVDGCVRDTEQIWELGFPVFAAGTSPLDTLARARVDTHGLPVYCGGLRIERGDVVVADSDGIVVVPASYIAAVTTFVANKRRLEQQAREDLLTGAPIREVWNKYGVF